MEEIVTPAVSPPELGAPVTVAEVKTYAKRRCKYCYGSGDSVRVLSRTGAPVTKENRARALTVCGCAQSAFMKHHNHETVLTDTGLFWLSSIKPAPAPVAPAPEGEENK